MLSNLENNLKSRDRNLNFNLSDATSMQVLDNQGRENAPKYPTSSQPNPEVRSKREYDNYFNTFSNGSNKNKSNKEPCEALKKTSKIAQEESSTSTALKSLKKNSSSMESPSGRKLIRTPTQVNSFTSNQIFSKQCPNPFLLTYRKDCYWS